MELINFSNSIIHPVESSIFEKKGVQVDIKRDDLLHPIISGNKWRKLQYLIKDAIDRKSSRIISMGGNWSNHLHALAFAAKEFNIKASAFVRSHPEQPLTATLKDCQSWGMTLTFTNRKDYAELRKLVDWQSMQKNDKGSYWISEGGFSSLAIQGVADISQEVSKHYDYIFVACGSGSTLLGLSHGFPKSHIVGIASFSGAEYLKDVLSQKATGNNWSLDTNYHCGGFAKTNTQLNQVITELERVNDFKLDKLYNGKVFLALNSYIELGKIESGCRVLVLHTGGLQGLRSEN